VGYLVINGHSGILSITFDFTSYNLDYAVETSISIAKMLVDSHATVKFDWRGVAVTVRRDSNAQAIIKAAKNAQDGCEVGP
jgi:hypothetical protein